MFLTHRDDADGAIARLARRYLGFDLNSDDVRKASRGYVAL